MFGLLNNTHNESLLDRVQGEAANVVGWFIMREWMHDNTPRTHYVPPADITARAAHYEKILAHTNNAMRCAPASAVF